MNACLSNMSAKMNVAATLERPATGTRNGGSEMHQYATASERFWSKVDKSGECWTWMAGAMPSGYGHFYTSGKTVKAHRYAWEDINGPIPAGKLVCHRCDNPPCVRPDHLFLGTYLDNNRDRSNKGRCAFGERNGWATHPEALLIGELNPRASLNADSVRLIRASEGEPYSVLAKRFGVTNSAIAAVRQGRTWRHVS